MFKNNKLEVEASHREPHIVFLWINECVCECFTLIWYSRAEWTLFEIHFFSLSISHHHHHRYISVVLGLAQSYTCTYGVSVWCMQTPDKNHWSVKHLKRPLSIDAPASYEKKIKLAKGKERREYPTANGIEEQQHNNPLCTVHEHFFLLLMLTVCSCSLALLCFVLFTVYRRIIH